MHQDRLQFWNRKTAQECIRIGYSPETGKQHRNAPGQATDLNRKTLQSKWLLGNSNAMWTFSLRNVTVQKIFFSKDELVHMAPVHRFYTSSACAVYMQVFQCLVPVQAYLFFSFFSLKRLICIPPYPSYPTLAFFLFLQNKTKNLVLLPLEQQWRTCSVARRRWNFLAILCKSGTLRSCSSCSVWRRPESSNMADTMFSRSSVNITSPKLVTPV